MRTEATDGELVARARRGDVADLARLVDRHRDGVWRLALRLLADPEEAADVVQEALLVAVADLDRLRDPARFGAWLAGITRNLCRRRLRRRSDWSWEALHGGRLVAEPADPGPRPDEVVTRREAEASIRRAVARLPDGQRDAVRLHYLDELTYEEVAAVLGIDVGAVKSRLHRARNTLRPRFEPRHPPPKEPTMTATDTLEMSVSDVRRNVEEDSHVVILTSDAGEDLHIWVGGFEATALALNLRDVETPRPLTYPFVAGLVGAIGGEVREVAVTRLDENGTFFAEVILDTPGGERRADARPSDAMNLAVVTGARTVVSRDVLRALDPPPDSYPDDFTVAFPDDTDAIVADFRATWERHACKREE